MNRDEGQRFPSHIYDKILLQNYRDVSRFLALRLSCLSEVLINVAECIFLVEVIVQKQIWMSFMIYGCSMIEKKKSKQTKNKHKNKTKKENKTEQNKTKQNKNEKQTKQNKTRSKQNKTKKNKQKKNKQTKDTIGKHVHVWCMLVFARVDILEMANGTVSTWILD